MKYEPECDMMWDKNGYIARRYWDNVFCKFCGTPLNPNESYGEGPGDGPGICMVCLRIIFDEIEEEMTNEY
jgi:hypothetical protein